jgi:MFS family permease
VLVACMILMGVSTTAVGLLPTYAQAGVLAPTLLVALRLVQGFAVAGEIAGSSSMILEHAPIGRRGLYCSFSLQGVQAGQILAAAVFIPLARFMPRPDFLAWGWRIPFLLSLLAVAAGYVIRRRVAETPVFAAERARGGGPRAPIVQALTDSAADMVRVACMALMNVIPVVTSIFGAAYAIQPGYGIGLPDDVYLWIPVLGNCVAVLVIPFAGQLSDRIGRRPPVVVGALTAGLLSFAYLYAISIRNVPLAIAMSIVMWGVVYQGYNAVFPSFYPELFPARTRVTAVAIAQNLGTTITALLPAVFAAVAPPGSMNVPVIVGGITFGVTAIAAAAAWTTRETYRIRLADLGTPAAVAIGRDEYERLRSLPAEPA